MAEHLEASSWISYRRNLKRMELIWSERKKKGKEEVGEHDRVGLDRTLEGPGRAAETEIKMHFSVVVGH